MGESWYRTGGRRWWVVMGLAFLVLELALRVKLGSVYVLAAGWVWVHQDLAGRLGDRLPRPGASDRLLYAMLAAFVAGLIIFAAFTVLTVTARFVDNDFRLFQLP